MRVTFLGAGLYGEALGKVAELNDHEVKYYDPFRFPDIKIEDVISEADAIIYVAPAEAYPEILPKLPKDVPLILASKGFVSLSPFEGFKNFSALGGAAFAEDIMERIGKDAPADFRPLTLTASSEISEQIFTTDFLRIEYTEDTKGIMLCGALKNVYAIGGGLLMSDDQPEQYLTEAYFEIQDLLLLNGCNSDTATLSCGAPDLVLSCTMEGRNFRFGDEMRAHPGSRIEPVGTVEGVNVIKSLDNFPDFIWPKDDKQSLMTRIVEAVLYATE